MKTKLFGYVVLCCIVVFTLGLMTGCKGSNGSNGMPGANGKDGANGTDAPSTSETCMICHTTGRTADLAIYHADSTNDNLVVTINSVQNVGGKPVVSFKVQVKNHTTGALTNLTSIPYGQSIKIADLVTVGTSTRGSDYYEMWVAETPNQVACAADTKINSTGTACSASAGALATPATANYDTTDAANGNYKYTFSTSFGSAWPGYNNADYAAGNPKRVAIEFSKPATGYNKAVGVLDFAGDPGIGNTATVIDSQRQFVTIQACQKCHGPLMDNAAHASSRNDIRLCDFCHSALYGSQPAHAAGFMAEDNADLPVFIHKIHAAKNVPAFEERMEGYTAVTFPQDVKDCTICHINLTGASLGTGDQIDNWKNHPSARACASCHDTNTINADGSMNHMPGSPNGEPATPRANTTCAGCHQPDDIALYHDTTVVAGSKDDPEYDVTLTIAPPANGTNFVTGETLTVDVTLTPRNATCTQVPAAYTTAQDAAYVNGNGLRTASLYIYGPRSWAKPLTGTQANSLFGKGDATGFHFHTTIPATAAKGTYMVRARIGDYSYNRSVAAPAGQDAYRIESIALSTIQIGTATADKKVDGNACSNCHGATLMHKNDHQAPFDTDHCSSCHDQSGGHAAYIGNRVHAVHAASVSGDQVAGRDWSEITFPQVLSKTNCNICHTSGNNSFRVNIYQNPCMGCHADNTTTMDHMLQNGGVTYPLQ